MCQLPCSRERYTRSEPPVNFEGVDVSGEVVRVDDVSWLGMWGKFVARCGGVKVYSGWN